MGLIQFSDDARLTIPLATATSYTQFEGLVKQGFVYTKGVTNTAAYSSSVIFIRSALETAYKEFLGHHDLPPEHANPGRVVIVITDGA